MEFTILNLLLLRLLQITNEKVDYIVKVILMTGQSVFSSAFIARVSISLVDKGIAVLAA